MEEILLGVNYNDLINVGLIAFLPALLKYCANQLVEFKQDLEKKLATISELQAKYDDVHKKLEDFIHEHREREKIIDNKINNLITATERRANKYIDITNDLTEKINEQDEKIKIIKDGGLAILSDRLQQSLTFFLKQGYTTQLARQNLHRLYETYHNHGGNSWISEMYAKYKQLPLEDEYFKKV